MVVWGRKCGLSMACLWPGFGLDLENLGVGSKNVYARVVACLCGL